MEDHPLLVFSLDRAAPPLRTLRDALRTAGYPVEIGVREAGEATDAELDSPDWEIAFIRWMDPEMHEVAVVERDLRDEDELAQTFLAEAERIVASRPESAGRLIMADHLGRMQAVYSLEILSALIADEDHPAWTALDVALRSLAESAEGIIYAAGEGFYDADGELLLAEDDEGASDELDLSYEWAQDENAGNPDA